jgi:transcriptional regulator with XRE-family HTH domain
MTYLTVNIYDKEDRARVVRVLTRARYQQNLSQAKVAEMAGVAVPHLSRCEVGFRIPHIRVTRAWAEALGVTLIETHLKDTQ